VPGVVLKWDLLAVQLVDLVVRFNTPPAGADLQSVPNQSKDKIL